MTELEILAELKKAYLLLEDIGENADNTQIDELEKKELFKISSELDKIYSKTYKNIMKENNNILYYKEAIKIGNTVFIDYTLENQETKEAISYKDMDKEAKWWENYEFLLQ